jgi:VanZ family protein
LKPTEATPTSRWRERPAFWWSLFALGTLVILALVPFAAPIQRSLRAAIGAQGVRWALIGVVAVLAAVAVRRISRRQAAIAPASVLRIVAVPAVAAGWMAGMEITAEAVHLVEYGVLGAVAFRALAFHTAGFRTYAAAVALTASAGVLDEVVQRLTPGRFWDLRDVGLNAAGAVLAQLWIATAITRRDR